MKKRSFILISLLIFLLVLAFPAYAAVCTYDGLNRLKSVTYENGLQITYNYDAAGNVLSVRSTGIGNNNPEVGDITIIPNLVPVNTSVSACVYYTDPDAGDTHTAAWDWGDGTNTPGTVNEAEQKVTGTYQYTNPGVYTVKVIVSDNGSATGEAVYQYVVVYNPKSGFVTGSGWINSPAGAYINEPALTGKAIFGFVS